MRTNVTFRHPAKFLGIEDVDAGVLAVRGAHWFAKILTRVPHLELDRKLCQEDWGVVLFARRNQNKFWIGLSAWDSDGAWLAHIHHGSFAWLQWFRIVREISVRYLLRGTRPSGALHKRYRTLFNRSLLSSRGNDELKCLLADIHNVLASEPAITDIAWHEENDINNPEPVDFPRPF